MITFTTSTTSKDLQGILDLQKSNLSQNLTDSEISSQGFVTVTHTMEDLKKLNDFEKHLVIKNNDEVIGYVLAMTKHSSNDIPVLIPMFDLFDTIGYKNKLISNYNYLVVGQVCIDKRFRAQGLFDKGYATYKAFFKEKYDFAITEISLDNTRSIKAHKRIGFIEIHTYKDSSDMEWSVVLWDWNQHL